MVADLPVTDSPRESLMGYAARWAAEATPRQRSMVAAVSFVTMGLSVLASATVPLLGTGTGAVGCAGLVLALWSIVAQADRRRPRPVLRLVGRGLAGLAVAAIGLAAAAFLLALLGQPWTL